MHFLIFVKLFNLFIIVYLFIKSFEFSPLLSKKVLPYCLDMYTEDNSNVFDLPPGVVPS